MTINENLSLEFCLAIDASGSNDEKIIKSFLAKVYSSLVDLKHSNMKFNVKVIYFTHYINSVVDINLDNIDEILDCNLHNGGSMAECVYDCLKSINYIPQRLVFFTDGFLASYGDPNYCSTTFMIHGEMINSSHKPPYGTTSYFSHDE